MKSRLNFSQRTHPIHSIGPKTDVLGRLEPFRYCTKVDAKLDELARLTPKFAKWSCFDFFSQRTHVIHSVGPKTQVNRKCLISKSSGPFRYSTKVDAKLVELVPLTHKFAKWSHVWIFRNERTQSTPLDPKLMFWCVSDRFVTARKMMQNWPNWSH
jgi:hypothetical protein